MDCETDGVHPDRRVWEIAIIRRDPGFDDVEWSAFVEIDLSTADRFGLRVGRFYDRHPLGRLLSEVPLVGSRPGPRRSQDWPVEHGVPRSAAARAVAQWTHGAHLVGAVPNFDAEVFDRLLRAHALLPTWHYHLCDVETLAVGYLAGQGRPVSPPWSSEELSEAVGVPVAPEEERHTALGDARWAKAIYDAVMGTGS